MYFLLTVSHLSFGNRIKATIFVDNRDPAKTNDFAQFEMREVFNCLSLKRSQNIFDLSRYRFQFFIKCAGFFFTVSVNGLKFIEWQVKMPVVYIMYIYLFWWIKLDNPVEDEVIWTLTIYGLCLYSYLMHIRVIINLNTWVCSLPLEQITLPSHHIGKTVCRTRKPRKGGSSVTRTRMLDLGH